MNQKKHLNRPNKQKKYRQSQSNKGLVRYELQVSQEAKELFEQMVEAAAAEYLAPWDKRQRQAKARSNVFEKLVDGIKHDFFALKDQVASLKKEVTALSPIFFKTDSLNKSPLPEAIRSLPDDPYKLKSILAETFRVAQLAKISSRQHKEDSDRLQKLYDATYDYNESLKKKLDELKEEME